MVILTTALVMASPSISVTQWRATVEVSCGLPVTLEMERGQEYTRLAEPRGCDVADLSEQFNGQQRTCGLRAFAVSHHLHIGLSTAGPDGDCVPGTSMLDELVVEAEARPADVALMAQPHSILVRTPMNVIPGWGARRTLRELLDQYVDHRMEGQRPFSWHAYWSSDASGPEGGSSESSVSVTVVGGPYFRDAKHIRGPYHESTGWWDPDDIRSLTESERQEREALARGLDDGSLTADEYSVAFAAFYERVRLRQRSAPELPEWADPSIPHLRGRKPKPGAQRITD